MARPLKQVAAEDAGCGFLPLRQYWRQVNRQERQVELQQRLQRKTHDKKRAKCGCDAYPWPHRPRGGLCRHPDAPEVRWQDRQAAEINARVAEFRKRWGEPTAEQMADLVALTIKRARPYRHRYAGIRRQIARANCLHPIRDRALIETLMPRVLMQAKEVKRRAPRAKYRNMVITENGVRGQWQSAGPMM